MKKTVFVFLASPFPWFFSCSTAIAQAPVAQSDQITGNGPQQIIQRDNSPESIIS